MTHPYIRSSPGTVPSRLLTTLLVAGLLFGTFDLHSLLHPAADGGAHSGHDPEPIHLDRGHIDVPCPACLFGLKSQSRPTETPRALSRPDTHSRLAVVEVVFDVAELSYRLPLTRAPPLS